MSLAAVTEARRLLVLLVALHPRRLRRSVRAPPPPAAAAASAVLQKRQLRRSTSMAFLPSEVQTKYKKDTNELLNNIESVSHYYSISFEACIPKTFAPVRIERFRKEVFHEKLQVQRSHGISDKIYLRKDWNALYGQLEKIRKKKHLIGK